jgi:bacteriocin biosynthesis cyclodehydratase domain-containing protein
MAIRELDTYISDYDPSGPIVGVSYSLDALATERSGLNASLSELILNPSVRVLWRDGDTVQLELGARALIVEGIESTQLAALIAGPATAFGAGAPATSATVPPRSPTPLDSPGLGLVLAQLAAEGFVWRRPVTTNSPAHPALASELAALHTRHGVRAEQVLADRSEMTVVLHGTGRLAVDIACLLAAANVGQVNMYDSGEVHRYDSAPGGLLSSDEGRRFGEAAHDAIRRAAPTVRTEPVRPTQRPDLAVLTGEAPVDPELRAWLHDDGVAHLVVRTGADESVIGPLVLPGLTSCLACADLTRIDRDPSWSVLAVQLATPRRHAGPADIALTSLTAALAAVQALAYLDGDEPAALTATLELHPPDWRLRRRSWPPHPACECGVGGETAQRWAQ